MDEILKTGTSPVTDMIAPTTNIDPELQRLLELMSDPKMVMLFVLVALWALVWKGFALWRAARNHQLYWFMTILGVNSVGILEILYIFVFAKDKNKKSKK